MKQRLNLYPAFVFTLMVMLTFGCKDKMEEPIRPFSIMTELNKDVNQMFKLFALPNNYVVATSKKEYGVYLFNQNFLPLKQFTFDVRTELAGPFMIGNDHFGVIAEDVTNGMTHVYMFDFQLNMIEKRRINHLFLNVASGLRYNAYAAQAPDGSVIIACNNEKYPGGKISVISIKNIMEDNVRAWSWVAPNWTGDWLLNLHVGEDGAVYVAGYPNPGNENFLIKINANGTFGFRKSFPFFQTSAKVFTMDSRLIYHDHVDFYDMDLNGNLQQKVHLQDNEWSRVSNLISSGSDFYFYKDTITVDGKFAALYKTNEKLQVKKVRILGNQGTNAGWYEHRNLIKMPNGDMVFSALIENPDLSGNYWFFSRFDSELKLAGE